MVVSAENNVKQTRRKCPSWVQEGPKAESLLHKTRNQISIIYKVYK